MSSFVFLNWKGGLRKNKTWKAFRRDSKMINRMKNKTSDERWKELELFAALRREATKNDLTERMVASSSQSEDRLCRSRNDEKKRRWLSQAPQRLGMSRTATHHPSRLWFAHSYYLCFCNVFLLRITGPYDVGHVLNKIWYQGASCTQADAT